MPARLEEVVKKIFTYKSVYPWRLECTDVSPAPEYDTDSDSAYRVEVVRISDEGGRKVFNGNFTIPKLVRGSLESGNKKRQSIYTALHNSVIRIGNRFFAWGNGYTSYQSFDFSTKRNQIEFKQPYNVETRTRGDVTTVHASNFLKYWNKWDENKIYLFSKESLTEADQKYNEEVPLIEFINSDLVIGDEVLRKLKFLS